MICISQFCINDLNHLYPETFPLCLYANRVKHLSKQLTNLQFKCIIMQLVFKRLENKGGVKSYYKYIQFKEQNCYTNNCSESHLATILITLTPVPSCYFDIILALYLLFYTHLLSSLNHTRIKNLADH
jgi:hypothetical protein